MGLKTILNPKDEADILMREYGFIKSEMQTYIGLFHRYTNMLPVLISAAVAFTISILSALVKESSNDLLGQMKSFKLFSFGVAAFNAFEVFMFFLFILLITSCLFTIAASLSYIHVLEVLCVRGRQIEEEVNRLFGRKLMNWEIELSPNLIRNSTIKGFWILPSSMRLFWNFTGIFALVFFLFIISQPLLGPILTPLIQMYASVGLLFQSSQYLLYKREVLSLRQMAENMKISKIIEDD